MLPELPRRPSQPSQRSGDPVEDPVDESRGFRVAEPVSQVHGLVYGDLRRDLAGLKLVDSQAQDISFDDGDTVQAPILGGTSGVGIELLDVGDDGLRQGFRSIEDPGLRPGKSGQAGRDPR